MKEDIEELQHPYRFMVLERRGSTAYKGNYHLKIGDDIWTLWTGGFKSTEEAMDWFAKHGNFHITEGHTLGLFKDKKLITKYHNGHERG